MSYMPSQQNGVSYFRYFISLEVNTDISFVYNQADKFTVHKRVLESKQKLHTH
jgi:hypothetical protein